MFSTEDVRELLQAFPPPKIGIASLPSLVESTSGQDLISLQHVQARFETRVNAGQERISLLDLSSDLGVNSDIILQLVHNQPHLALLSNDNTNVIPKAERDAIAESLQESLFGPHSRLISKPAFASQNAISPHSLDSLLSHHQDHLVHYTEHVCAKHYDTSLSNALATTFIDPQVTGKSHAYCSANDIAHLPGSPPQWFVLQHLHRLAASPAYRDQVLIRSGPDLAIRIQSTQARAHSVATWTHIVHANDLAYIDLQALMRRGGLYDSLDDAVADFTESRAFALVGGVFALSVRWLHALLDARVRALHYAEDGVLDVLAGFAEKVQRTRDWEGHRRFPASAMGEVTRLAEGYVDGTLGRDVRQFGSVLVTDERYARERDDVLSSAQDSAATQWQRLEDGEPLELKFSFPDPPAHLSAPQQALHAALAHSKPLQKAAEDRFWTHIAALESHNESAFAAFWTERVTLRIDTYTHGLSSIEDTKLRDQLSGLLATYMQTELIPDAIAKATAQRLVLSRKTRKNLSKLQGGVSVSTESNVSSTLSSLEKFSSKQSIPSPPASALESYKASMLQDMQRRMTKQTKSSDGPVLFLTLVVILHAKYFPGVVYATGKYAPKLLKMLKGRVGEAEYEVLEGWKEGARKGVLGEGEREEMRGMAGGKSVG